MQDIGDRVARCAPAQRLATSFSLFYEHCPILKPEDDAVGDARLALPAQTAEVLRTGSGCSASRCRRS